MAGSAPFPPAECWWAHTIELSTRWSVSGDLALKALKMRTLPFPGPVVAARRIMSIALRQVDPRGPFPIGQVATRHRQRLHGLNATTCLHRVPHLMGTQPSRLQFPHPDCVEGDIFGRCTFRFETTTQSQSREFNSKNCPRSVVSAASLSEQIF